MTRIPIAVAATILAAAGICSPAQALPQSPPAGAHAGVPAPLLLPARYHRHRHYRRHETRPAQERPAAATDADAEAIKPGQWEFAAQLEAAALPSPGLPAAPGADSGGGATKSTYDICVAPDKAVPSAFVAGCRLDAVHRDGGRITWSMTCTNRQNAVRSDGVAQYRGDTMTATTVSHLPSAKAGGKPIDVAQYISGHYLGPCPTATAADAAATATPAAAPTTTAAAAAPTITTGTAGNTAAPAGNTAASSGNTAAAAGNAAASSGNTAAPAATAAIPPTNAAAPTTSAAGPAATATAPATSSPATATTAATTPPGPAATEGSPGPAAGPEASAAAQKEEAAPWRADEHAARHHRYRRHYASRRRHRRYYGGGFYGNGTYSGFGPNPYSANGY